ncbi:hypothetical protein BP00DRAFT_443705 [Aspergillus indologenus CBS 114.80]|uniref:Uncharacterized protein n=1 Tax=Aspergillus indologenus CBS 114.80 TaxID=1450541 RepID=A0A2V5IZ55_9EURO|nr:hypothetical protein BP00DRAFT_443705 [Aspergillus indologenus CBS 114.80]
MSLSELPPERLLIVVESLPSKKAIHSLVQTYQSLLFQLDPYLYRYHVRKGDVSAWKHAAVNNHPGVVRKLLDAGAILYDSTRWYESGSTSAPIPTTPSLLRRSTTTPAWWMRLSISAADSITRFRWAVPILGAARIVIKNDGFDPEVQAALDCAVAKYDFESVVAPLKVEGLEV